MPGKSILSWAEDPKTTQTITWWAGIDTSQNKVQYLPAEDFSGSFNGVKEADAEETDHYSGHSHFEATLRELAPASSYIYRVGSEGAWSEPASFTTAGADDKFSFLYLGDVQQGYENWGKMLRSAAVENPGLKFALMGGDLVSDGTSNDEWQKFFAAAAPVFKEIPLMPAAGNHDDTPLFWKSFALPLNGPEGFKEKFYSFDYGNCHIVVLNSNNMGSSGADYDKITAWLRNDLDNSGKQWKFIVFHYPPYPVDFDGHAGNLQENWVPLFEKGGVDAVFVGHQHVYMRTKPLRDNRVQADGQGIVYIMGNAGDKYYDAGPDYDYIAKELADVSNYEVISIDGDTFNLTAKDAGGQIIDSYVLKKQ